MELLTQICPAHRQERSHAIHLIRPVIKGIELYSAIVVAKCNTGSVLC